MQEWGSEGRVTLVHTIKEKKDRQKCNQTNANKTETELASMGIGRQGDTRYKKQLDRKNRKNKSKQTNAKKVKESLQELGLGGRVTLGTNNQG